MYILIEMQTSGDTTSIPPIATRADWQEAEAEFHRLCSIAAVSSVPIHTVMMADEYGNTQRAEHYVHSPEEVV